MCDLIIVDISMMIMSVKQAIYVVTFSTRLMSLSFGSFVMLMMNMLVLTDCGFSGSQGAQMNGYSHLPANHVDDDVKKSL